MVSAILASPRMSLAATDASDPEPLPIGRSAPVPADWERNVNVESYSATELDGPEALQNFQQIKDVGATGVTIVVQLYQQSPEASLVTAGVATPSDETLHRAITTIQELGMRVTVKLHVDVPDFSTWRGNFEPADRPSWFASYDEQVQHYAELSQDAGVESFCIGTEMESLTRGTTSEWLAIIGGVRDKYRGQVTYDAQRYDATLPEGVGFWDALDVISLSGYFPMGPGADVPSMVSELRAADTTYVRPLWERHHKPIIFGEIGIRSLAGATVAPYAWATSGDPDPELQARAYEAMFQYWSSRPYVSGFHLWKWEIGDLQNTDQVQLSTAFTPQGKPALDVVRAWFTQPVLPPRPRRVRPAGEPPSLTITSPEEGESASLITVAAVITDGPTGRSDAQVWWSVGGDVRNPLHSVPDRTDTWVTDIDVSDWSWSIDGDYTIDVCTEDPGEISAPTCDAVTIHPDRASDETLPRIRS